MFLAMAYYGGETLKKRIDRGPLEIDEAIDIAIQVAQDSRERTNRVSSTAISSRPTSCSPTVAR